MMAGSVRIAGILLCLAAISISGCSSGGKGRPPMGRVKGRVTYNGKPVGNASVTFFLDGAPRSATGLTDADGKFTLTTFDTDDGAIVGQHTVTVTKLQAIPGNKKPADMKPEDLAKMSTDGSLKKLIKTEGIPSKYADVKTTNLKYTIEAGNNNKEIDLKD